MPAMSRLAGRAYQKSSSCISNVCQNALTGAGVVMDETVSKLSSRYCEPITDVESENVNIRTIFIVSNNIDPDERLRLLVTISRRTGIHDLINP